MPLVSSLTNQQGVFEERSSPVVSAVTIMAIGVTIFSVLPRVDADPDLWGHLRFGLEHVQSGQLASHDPYSYTAPGNTWINHEWLTEWLFGMTYRAAGSMGLLVLRAFLLAVCVGGLALLAVRRGMHAVSAVWWFLFVTLILAEFFRVRPQMFTFACMTMLLAVCEISRHGRSGIVWIIPVLMMAWTNLHAGFVAGLGIFTIYWIAWCVNSYRAHGYSHEVIRMVGLFLATYAATCVNPYGPGYWSFVVFAVTMPRPGITEWESIFHQNAHVVTCYIAAVVLPAWCWTIHRDKVRWTDGAIFLLGAVLAARHCRHFPFLLLFGTQLMTYLHVLPWCTRWLNWTARRPALRVCSAWVWLCSICFVISAGVARSAREVRNAHDLGVITVSKSAYPVDAVGFLASQNLTGNLDCGFNWGEYCLFHLHPQFRIFCDGRYETVYPRQITDLLLTHDKSEVVFGQRLRKYRTDVVLVRRDDAFGEWVAHQPDFLEIYRDGTARVLLHRSRMISHFPEPTFEVNTLDSEVRPACVPFPATYQPGIATNMDDELPQFSQPTTRRSEHD